MGIKISINERRSWPVSAKIGISIGVIAAITAFVLAQLIILALMPIVLYTIGSGLAIITLLTLISLCKKYSACLSYGEALQIYYVKQKEEKLKELLAQTMAVDSNSSYISEWKKLIRKAMYEGQTFIIPLIVETSLIYEAYAIAYELKQYPFADQLMRQEARNPAIVDWIPLFKDAIQKNEWKYAYLILVKKGIDLGSEDNFKRIYTSIFEFEKQIDNIFKKMLGEGDLIATFSFAAEKGELQWARELVKNSKIKDRERWRKIHNDLIASEKRSFADLIPQSQVAVSQFVSLYNRNNLDEAEKLIKNSEIMDPHHQDWGRLVAHAIENKKLLFAELILRKSEIKISDDILIELLKKSLNARLASLSLILINRINLSESELPSLELTNEGQKLLKDIYVRPRSQ